MQKREKVVGKRRRPQTPQEFLTAAERMNSELQFLVPAQRPRGFVMKFKTPDDYQKWKAAQINPWLR